MSMPVPPTPEAIAVMVSDALLIYGWDLSSDSNVVKIDIGPFGDGDKPLMNFRAVVVEGDETPIVLPRPSYEPYGLDLEGGAFGDDDTEGWQVVPYSSVRQWPCTLNEADSILFRGAPGHISFAEARRFGVALITVSDLAEARMGSEVASRPLGSPTLLAGHAYINTDDGYPWLTCSGCDAPIHCIGGGDDFADLNAKVAEHTCPPAASLSDTGEADTRG